VSQLGTTIKYYITYIYITVIFFLCKVFNLIDEYDPPILLTVLWFPFLIFCCLFKSHVYLRRNAFFLFRSISYRHWRTGFQLCCTETEFSRSEEKEQLSSDVPAYARLYLFQSPRTYPILTLGYKSDARIHGYNNTRLLMRALSRFRRSASPVIPFSRDYYSHYIFPLWSLDVIQNAHFYCLPKSSVL